MIRTALGMGGDNKIKQHWLSQWFCILFLKLCSLDGFYYICYLPPSFNSFNCILSVNHSHHTASRFCGICSTRRSSVTFVTSVGESVLSINTTLTEVHETWAMLPAWWKAEMVRFCCLSYCFIHQLPFINPFLFHTHPSFCFILLCHCPQWVSVSKFHLSAPSRGGDRADEAQGRDIKHGMLALPPPTPSSHLYLSSWLLHLSAHDLELAVAGEKERPSTNDKWQSQNKHTSEGGEEKKSWITLSSSVSLWWSSH